MESVEKFQDANVNKIFDCLLRGGMRRMTMMGQVFSLFCFKQPWKARVWLLTTRDCFLEAPGITVT